MSERFESWEFRLGGVGAEEGSSFVLGHLGFNEGREKTGMHISSI